jgi:uncharacterized protein YfbU (UPF0304 family)
MKNEIWKDIKGFEDRYQVSNQGKVLSKGRSFIAKDGYRRTYPKKQLQANPTKPLWTKVHRFLNLTKVSST